MFKAKEFPYLFTILISMVAWTVDHLTEELLTGKTLMYKEKNHNIVYNGPFDKFSEQEFQLQEYEITNLTNDHLFKNIHFSVISNDSDTIFIKDIIGMDKLLFKKGRNQDTVVSHKTHVIIDGLHPRTSAKVMIFYRGKTKPVLYLDYIDGKRNSKEPILLIESGVRTGILNYQLEIFSLLLVLWLILVGIYMIKV